MGSCGAVLDGASPILIGSLRNFVERGKVKILVAFFREIAGVPLHRGLRSPQPEFLLFSACTFECTVCGKLACDHGNRPRLVLDQHGERRILGGQIGTALNVKTTTRATTMFSSNARSFVGGGQWHRSTLAKRGR